ncbi:MAG: MIP/aquaporin family protein [Xenococcaceae cyanobacterium]
MNHSRFLWQSFACCWRESIAECIGTFILIFAGTGAVMVDTMTGGSITHLGISFVFGAVVAALIYATGHISQAHLNPAVTLAFWTSGFFPIRKVLPYIIAQFTGAIAASTMLLLALGNVADLGATKPLNGNWMQSFILEIILTFILMFVIFGSGLDRRAHGGFAGLAIGLTVGLEAAFMGPITGASMNPARSIAPALVAGIWQHQWVYLVAPTIGAQLAVLVYGVISQGFKDFE